MANKPNITYPFQKKRKSIADTLLGISNQNGGLCSRALAEKFGPKSFTKNVVRSQVLAIKIGGSRFLRYWQTTFGPKISYALKRGNTKEVFKY
jgi:hypothetical protein